MPLTARPQANCSMHGRNLPRRNSANRTHVDIKQQKKKKNKKKPILSDTCWRRRDDRVDGNEIIAPRAKNVKTTLDDSLRRQTKQVPALLSFLCSKVHRSILGLSGNGVVMKLYFVLDIERVILNALFHRAGSRNKIGARLWKKY